MDKLKLKLSNELLYIRILDYFTQYSTTNGSDCNDDLFHCGEQGY